MAVVGVGSELVSRAIACSTGKEQGISPVSRITEAGSAKRPVQIQSVEKEFSMDSNREFFQANRELQERSSESIFPASQLTSEFGHLRWGRRTGDSSSVITTDI